MVQGEEELKKYKIISGLDPNAMVLDTGITIIKVAKMESFYAEMHINALQDIHDILSRIKVAPKLMYIEYRDGYVVSEFEKIEQSDKIASSYEVGCALGKAHNALKTLKLEKLFRGMVFMERKMNFKGL